MPRREHDQSEHDDPAFAPPVETVARREGYFHVSSRPLTMLVFLLPLVIAYEVGSLLFLAGDHTASEGILARRLLSQVFELFGATVGLILPGLLLITVLGLQHILRRDPWKIRLGVLPVMVVESLVLTAPLLVLALAIGPTGDALTPAAGAGPGLLELPWTTRLTIAIGAGVYEELVFRLVLITLIHLIAVDLLRRRDRTGRILAVLLSAIAFTVYHDLGGPAGGIDIRRAAFFLAAGVYFGVLFLWRGLGMPVAVHVVYDVLVLLVLVEPQADSG